VVVAITDPLATRRIVGLVHRLNPGAKLIARTRYVRDVDALQTLGATAVVAEELEAAIDLLPPGLREFGPPAGARAGGRSRSAHARAARVRSRERGRGGVRGRAARRGLRPAPDTARCGARSLAG